MKERYLDPEVGIRYFDMADIITGLLNENTESGFGPIIFRIKMQ